VQQDQPVLATWDRRFGDGTHPWGQRLGCRHNLRR
jgi:hypothetical protein